MTRRISSPRKPRKENTDELIARCEQAAARWEVKPSPDAWSWFAQTVREDLFEAEYQKKQETAQ